MEFDRVEAQQRLDLIARHPAPADLLHRHAFEIFEQKGLARGRADAERTDQVGAIMLLLAERGDRKSVVEGKSVSVRVDLGGRRIIQKKNYRSTNITCSDNESNNPI